MLNTYHIHVKGIVQGVGFRPFVYRLANKMNLKGWVNNNNEGVIIEFNASATDTAIFYHEIKTNPPVNALITYHDICKIAPQEFSEFIIKESSGDANPDLLLTPDIAICSECKKEITSPSNKRNGYAFTTCLNCGPRYSIVHSLPYDRAHTSMNNMPMCSDCQNEYQDVYNRRYFSQTNSCKSCAIKMHLYQSNKAEINCADEEMIDKVVVAFLNGKIVAVKGIGGYLLMCDATNAAAIATLRSKKNRPTKPLAVLYNNLILAKADAQLRTCEINALETAAAPIVLSKFMPVSGNQICKELIAPGLDKLGVMIAYTPLLFLITQKFGKPLIATSANISGSPIIYNDEDALENLFAVADLLLSYDRDILIPQDDSVIQFSKHGQKIILRRARGLAPNYFPNPFKEVDHSILAMGSELKSAFAITNRKNVYISQYLGDQGGIESQVSYAQTLAHMQQLLKITPDQILIDAHPLYSVSNYGKELSFQQNCNSIITIQHHKAHFGALLAEHHLIDSNKQILGVVWDGTGYGDDGQIWGSEFFLYQQHEMKRIAHLQYFPQFAGDKMSREPRLCALSLLKNFPQYQLLLKDHFSTVEWTYFEKLLSKEQPILTSSMGRFLDGIACILGIINKQSYEGEAAMLLETMARKSTKKQIDPYTFKLKNGVIEWNHFIEALFIDIQNEIPVAELAWKVFYSLSKCILHIADLYSIHEIGFSGGVFQNVLLNELIADELSGKKQLYFHTQLSPNDECIGFGQLAVHEITKQNQSMLTASVNENNLTQLY